jgi:serine/threonine protein kinase
MKPTTADELAHRALELQLASPVQLQDAWAELGSQNVPLEQFGGVLLRREILTRYQLERLLRGERNGFFFGKAKILYQIGAGAFARVYRAVHADTGAIMAVKVLRNRYSSDEAKCRLFRREGEMGRLLRHPNIVAIEDVGQEANASYLTMEFVEGQTLRELVRIRGAVDLGRAIGLLIQLVSGLEYAHRRGVTHRDLKASNVLVSSTGQAKLVDFGLAGIEGDIGGKTLDRKEQPRTVDYAALEKLEGLKEDSLRSDIYFLGTIAYLALSGQSALAESRDRAVREDPRRFTAVVPLATRAPNLPRDVVDVVMRMMHVDPDARWQSAADVHRALEPLAALHGGDGTASPDGVGRQHSNDSGEFPAPTAMSAVRAATKGTLMLVEVSGTSQDALRQYLVKLGYRVLVTENPQRALVRFSTTPLPADCLVMSAQSLGEAALEAFNQLSKDPFYATVPAILLHGPKQQALMQQALLDSRRKILETPIHTRELIALLDSLIGKK